MAQRLAAWRTHLSALPMTNLRTYTTLTLAVLTAVVYLGLAVAQLVLVATGSLQGDEPLWKPSVEWLAFVAALSTADVAQFYAKRKTFNPNVASEQNGAA